MLRARASSVGCQGAAGASTHISADFPYDPVRKSHLALGFPNMAFPGMGMTGMAGGQGGLSPEQLQEQQMVKYVGGRPPPSAEHDTRRPRRREQTRRSSSPSSLRTASAP